jgi:hypothetical protein
MGMNSTYKKLAVQWLNEALCFVSSSVVADSFRLRNRQLLVAAKRYVLFEMKIWKTICIFFLFCHNLMGQTGTICFDLIESKTKSYVSEVKVFITDSLGMEILRITIADSSETGTSG